VADATVTLLRRFARGEKVSEAHRSHAYQHAALRWRTHLGVTVAVAAITLAWLLPIAMLVARGTMDGVAGVAIAYAPLIVVALWLDAGVPSTQHAASCDAARMRPPQNH
jgi:Fuc2NAc and GlcNAc transferase